MLVRLIMNGESVEIEEAETLDFASLPISDERAAREVDLEDLIARNVSLIETSGDGDQTLLVIGRQVSTVTGRKMDLVAMDKTGALILIEVKRDARDVRARRDNAEIQAVRYAASLAKLRTVDKLVTKLYAPYIESYGETERATLGGGRTAAEWARKKLEEFIQANEIERLNHAQKIVLIGAGFDDDTKSAAAWMAENGLPLRMIEACPYRLGDIYALDVRQVIPPQKAAQFYVDITEERSRRVDDRRSSASRAPRPRVRDLLAAGLIKEDDQVWFRNTPDRRAVLTRDGGCLFEGKEMSLAAYGRIVSGWGGVNVYEWIVHGPTGKVLGELRQVLEAQQDSDAETTEAAAEDL